MADTVAYVTAIEQLLIDVVAELGVTADRVAGYPGIWVEAHGENPRKLAAVGVRLSRGRESGHHPEDTRAIQMGRRDFEQGANHAGFVETP